MLDGWGVRLITIIPSLQSKNIRMLIPMTFVNAYQVEHETRE